MDFHYPCVTKNASSGFYLYENFAFLMDLTSQMFIDYSDVKHAFHEPFTFKKSYHSEFKELVDYRTGPKLNKKCLSEDK